MGDGKKEKKISKESKLKDIRAVLKYPMKERVYPLAPFTSIVGDRAKKIKYNDGFNNNSITKDHKTKAVYNIVLYRLLELMIMDVMEGKIVKFNKNHDAMIYVDFRKISLETMLNGVHERGKDVLDVDMNVTGRKLPIVAFDPGGERVSPCKLGIPKYLYNMLVEKVNEGTRYPKGNKDFFFNKNEVTERYLNSKDGYESYKEKKRRDMNNG